MKIQTLIPPVVNRVLKIVAGMDRDVVDHHQRRFGGLAAEVVKTLDDGLSINPVLKGIAMEILTQVQKAEDVLALVEGLKGKAAKAKGEITFGSLVSYLQTDMPKKIRLELGAEKVQRPFVEIGGY